MEKKKLYLLDAMALIYRSYYALNKNPRINSKGLNTSAVLGFANTLYDLIKSYKPTHIVVAIDTKAPTVRHLDFEKYKAHRDAMPEDIGNAIPYITKLIDAFNIPLLGIDGYEADDVIGTLALEASKKGFETYMVTPDKDFGQLVSNNVFIYKHGRMGNKDEVLGVEDVCDKFEIENPDQVRDILGIWGDASDNIPGIPGIGEKGAKKLVKEFGSIENMLANLDKIDNVKLREKIDTNREQALFSKKLATIITDVPVTFDEESFKIKPPKRKELKELLDELEMRMFAKRVFTDISVNDVQKAKTAELSLFDEVEIEEQEEVDLESGGMETIHTVQHKYTLINTIAEINSFIEKLKKQKEICFDVETTSLDAKNAVLVGIAFSLKAHEAYFVHFPKNEIENKSYANLFKEVFENESIAKVGQNLKYDITVLRSYGIEVKGKLFDTMLAHYLLEPEKRHNLDYLSEVYLRYTPVKIEELIGKKGKNQLSMSDVDIQQIKEYAGEDADLTLQLKVIFEPLLKEKGAEKLFWEIEMPLMQVLVDMEMAGVKIDAEVLKEYSHKLGEEVKQIEQEIFDLAGVTFNIGSPKQLGEVLFDKMKIIDNPKQTQSKQYSTGEEVLTKLINKHPIISKILEYRSLTKLKSTYIDVLPELVDKYTGKVHTSYNQAVAVTGRLSSNNPNLQNIPIRTERGREIRKSFIPSDERHVLLAADYSQIELRIIASLSGDEGMMQAFENGIDIHTATAAKIYGISIDEVTKDMRRNAKAVNFGIIYGISAFGLSEQLNISRKEAQEIINQYFVQYPKVKEYMDKSIEMARETGYAKTMLDRRRYLPDIHSRNAMIRGFSERNAINAPIQGSSADMIKIAMISIAKEFEEKKLQSKMVLQVHDELVFDVCNDELEQVKQIVSDKMQNALLLKVPVVIEMSVGKNWLEAH